MPHEEDRDFQAEILEVLKIPGVRQTTVAGWAGVDPSTVTRWIQGKVPSDVLATLKRLKPYVERARKDVVETRRTEVDSWAALWRDLDAGVRDYVEKSGLLAGTYHAIHCWIPSTDDDGEHDVMALRFFDGVWADMSRRTYYIGDQSQIVTLGDSERTGFDQPETLTNIVDMSMAADKEVGKSYAQLRVELNLEGFPHHNDSIGFVDGFGYRFRGRGAIVAKRGGTAQTNDFLGVPIVIPCRRLNMIVCIPKSCLRGSPSAMTYSNRAMLKVLTHLDDAEPKVIESLFWPRGRPYQLSGAPDAALKHLLRVASAIERMPAALQEGLKRPIDLNRPDQSIADVLQSSDSVCFLLDLSPPHPSPTATVIWRLAT